MQEDTDEQITYCAHIAGCRLPWRKSYTLEHKRTTSFLACAFGFCSEPSVCPSERNSSIYLVGDKRRRSTHMSPILGGEGLRRHPNGYVPHQRLTLCASFCRVYDGALSTEFHTPLLQSFLHTSALRVLSGVEGWVVSNVSPQTRSCRRLMLSQHTMLLSTTPCGG